MRALLAVRADVGIAALIRAVLSYHFLLLSVVLALFSVFMIVRPLVLKVTVDQSSVTVKGMFGENSLRVPRLLLLSAYILGRATT